MESLPVSGWVLGASGGAVQLHAGSEFPCWHPCALTCGQVNGAVQTEPASEEALRAEWPTWGRVPLVKKELGAGGGREGRRSPAVPHALAQPGSAWASGLAGPSCSPSHPLTAHFPHLAQSVKGTTRGDTANCFHCQHPGGRTLHTHLHTHLHTLPHRTHSPRLQPTQFHHLADPRPPILHGQRTLLYPLTPTLHTTRVPSATATATPPSPPHFPRSHGRRSSPAFGATQPTRGRARPWPTADLVAPRAAPGPAATRSGQGIDRAARAAAAPRPAAFAARPLPPPRGLARSLPPDLGRRPRGGRGRAGEGRGGEGDM